MSLLRIEKLSFTHLTNMLSIQQAAIVHMNARGIHQWDEVYPTQQILEADLRTPDPQGAYGLISGDTSERWRQLIGYVVLNDVQHEMYQTISWKEKKPLIIHRLTIHPGHQGKGYARQLMAFAEKFAAENFYDSIRLDAFIPNTSAVMLYEKCGYEKRGTIQFRKGSFWAFEKRIQQ